MSAKNSFSTQFQCSRILLFMIIISNVAINVAALKEQEGTPGWEWGLGPLVKRAERKSVVSTENGEISSVRVTDGTTGSYHLQFITLEPNSLFLPVVLHADMVFYVHTGSGKLTWMDENERKSVYLRIGDVFRLPFGIIFFLESNLEASARQKLRVYSIFANSGDDLREPVNNVPYSSIRNMVLGFDRKVLQAAFHVPEDVIDEVLNGTEVPAIVHGVPKSTKKNLWEMEAEFMKTLLGRGSYSLFDNKGNKNKNTKLFNVFQEKPDFQNCNGWSTVINMKKLPALKGSNIGIYVVNLTKGSMMAPHWNPMATEIGIAVQGEGMVRVVCSSIGTDQQGCKNMRFRVEEGDVFAVPRFHPMAQMAFNNNSFVFVGFSTTTKKHHPQYLTGKASVLRTLDRQILEASFNVTNTTMDQILEAQGDSVILECTSCAEEEMRLMEEERRREKEEARRREEEEARKREEEQRREAEEASRKEEEAARKAEEETREREAEEARRREEEAAREKEEERRRQQEEARKREEEKERERQEAEEARRKQEKEEARRREEEEKEARRQEEEIKRRQEEEEARRREEEEAQREAEEATRREEEQETRRQQEEESRRQEEEEEESRRSEEEEARTRQEEQEEEARRREEEEAARRQQEEEAQREEEEKRRREEEAETQEEKERRQEEEEEEAREEERRRQEEAERQEEEARRQEEETERRHQGEEETEEEEWGRHELIRRRTLLKAA
ncbi:hypothetical protein RND71_033153 [Anisodus tanguticus]|uniref:Cupin type-1 domain-containing protein n=1 Tax=Anisodus tanguticus TaxID=243964 RepID=A0AAE1R780_9SOLA|nr:hypothetical protein RND71_033153 [Anisodus tanguticus]